MRENILHYLWRYSIVSKYRLYTVKGSEIQVIRPGLYNLHSGPDFHDAQIRIGNQVWAGNVEIHVRSSDWILHGHHNDEAYNNVILHVVWEDDKDFTQFDRHIETLELQSVIPTALIVSIENLVDVKRSFINCESSLSAVDNIVLSSWLERMLIEKLELKIHSYFNELDRLNGDWESLSYLIVSRSFGLKVNADSFDSLARSVPYPLIRKLRTEVPEIESLLFGQAHLLDKPALDAYHSQLIQHYNYLQKKFKIGEKALIKPVRFRLRPTSFPEIRLSQLAAFFHKTEHIFRSIIELNSRKEFHEYFAIQASPYWNEHYRFARASKYFEKHLSPAFRDTLIINAVVPLKFMYAKIQDQDIIGKLIGLLNEIPAENNRVIREFNEIDVHSKGAGDSQALLYLWDSYCSKNKCLHCAIGNSILNRNT